MLLVLTDGVRQCLLSLGLEPVETERRFLETLPLTEAECSSVLEPVKSDRPYSVLLSMAGSIASGNAVAEAGSNKEQLVSIFSRLKLHDRPPAAPVRHLVVALSGCDRRVFPQSTFEAEPKSRTDQAEALLASWETARGRLKDVKGLYSYLLGLLTRFAWCLPAPGADDIPLLDYIRVKAAVAVALARRAEAEGLTYEELASSPKEKHLCLLGVDFAGIQQYLFGAARGKGAAKRLRARSFLVGMILEAFALDILDACDLPLTNLLFSNGGKFYLLLPNDAALIDKVKRRVEEEEAWLLGSYGGQITLSTGLGAFTPEEFADFGQALRMVEDLIRADKHRPHRSALQGGGGWKEEAFVIAREADGDTACTGCRMGRARQGSDLCPLCDGDERLGQELANASYIAYYRGSDRERGIPAGPAIRFEVFREPVVDGRNLLWAARLNETDLSPLAGLPAYTRFLANAIPLAREGDCDRCEDKCRDEERVDAGRPAHFDCLAASAKGRSYLAYLKMDVDNLGLLLTTGMAAGGLVSPAGVLAVSRMLEFFFGAYINALLAEKFNRCYTIYSGGDDLSVAGPWNEIVKLAGSVAEDFQIFTGNNPSVTISGGIVLADARYPVHMALAGAEDRLDKAKEKSGEHDTNPKNRCWSFGQLLGWRDFARAVREGDQLAEWVENDKTNSGFIQRLLNYWELYRSFLVEDKVQGLRYLPLLAFDLARNFVPTAAKRADKEWMAMRLWAQNLLHPKSPSMAAMGVIAGYARLATRKREAEADE